MKTIVGRFASAEDAAQAQALLNQSFAPVGQPRGSVGAIVSAITAVSALAGTFIGYLSANGAVANAGLTLDGGKSYLGVTTNDPLTLFGYSVLGLALGIVAGLILGVLATFVLPQPGSLPYRVAALAQYGKTVIVQSANNQADRIAKLLSDGHAQRVQTLNGRVDPVQVNSALEQLSR